jgi:benzoylformate decarboxylase
MAPRPAAANGSPDGVLSAAQVFAALNQVRPDHAVLVEESPSNLPDLHTAWPVTEPDTFYTFASGGLGWDLPAAVGIALAERDSGRNRCQAPLCLTAARTGTHSRGGNDPS